MLYLFQTVVYAGAFYLLYLLWLKDKMVHRFNRFYLLFCAVAPFLLPLAVWDIFSGGESLITQYLNVRMPEVMITDAVLEGKTADSSGWVLPSYLLVSGGFAAMALYRWARLRLLIGRSEKKKTADYTLLLNTGFGPGSWGRYIFLQGATADGRIIAHEAAHIRLKHSYDLNFLTIWQCFSWFNPFVHLIKKELRQVHEFEADAAVSSDKTEYQQLLLNQFLKQCQLPFTHSFINHPIKRRIMMLNKKVNNRTNKWRITLIATLALFLAGNIIWFQSCSSKRWEVKNNNEESHVNNNPGTQPEQPMPSTAPQPNVNISEFLAQNIRYPNQAKKAHIEGRVVVKFMIDKEGKVTNPKVIKSPSELLSEEALRVINLMPAWNPAEDAEGNKAEVWLTQPINFQLGKDNGKKQASLKSKAQALMAASRMATDKHQEAPAQIESKTGQSTPPDADMEARKKIFNRMINPFADPDEGC